MKKKPDNNSRNGPDRMFDIERICGRDLEATLAALRVVLGLPRVIPTSGQDDLPSDAS